MIKNKINKKEVDFMEKVQNLKGFSLDLIGAIYLSFNLGFELSAYQN
jgi:hypothetical protein